MAAVAAALALGYSPPPTPHLLPGSNYACPRIFIFIPLRSLTEISWVEFLAHLPISHPSTLMAADLQALLARNQLGLSIAVDLSHALKLCARSFASKRSA
jgi:hypothetical protein